jgi:membrane-bound lytic murein transglycosylase B
MFVRMAMVISLLIMVCPAWAASGSFDDWLADFRAEALNQGISQEVVQNILYDVKLLPRVLELDRKQPEHKITFAQYKKKILAQSRIDRGRSKMRDHHTVLNEVAQQSGVSPSMVVALWGLETSYGANTGGFDVINALATLAYDGRRSAFFRGELIQAMKILQAGHISRAKMKGSWAGAMGQNQFMPSSFQKLAIDGDGDGHKNIWTNTQDVFASSANYLKKNGWRTGEKWGRKVSVPRGKDLPVGLDVQKNLTDWAALGVRMPDGQPIPIRPDLKASLIQPDGAGGASYLVYENFRVLMRWNRSTYFALSAGILSDLIEHKG